MKAPKAKKTSSANLQPHGKQVKNPFFKKDTDALSPSKYETATVPFFQTKAEKARNFRYQPFLQPKLKIGKPDDKYEQEADQMAEKVVSQLSGNQAASTSQKGETSTSGGNNATAIQRTCDICDKEEKINKKEGEEELKKSELGLQSKAIFESNDEPSDLNVQTKPIATSGIQFKCAECEEKEQLNKKEEEISKKEQEVTAKPIFESNSEPLEDQDTVQTKSEGESTASTDLQSQLSSSKGKGHPLPSNTQSSMGNAFGADFSGVRIHTDSEAVKMNQNLGAQAFTHGNDIYFNENKYDTSSSDGNKLLAHELTHTVQQLGPKVKPKKDKEDKPEAGQKEKIINKKGPENTNKADKSTDPKKEAINNDTEKSKEEGGKNIKDKVPSKEEVKGKKPEDQKEAGKQKPEKTKKDTGKKEVEKIKKSINDQQKLKANIRKPEPAPLSVNQEIKPLPSLSDLLTSQAEPAQNPDQSLDSNNEETVQLKPDPSPKNPEPEGDVKGDYLNRISNSKNNILNSIEQRFAAVSANINQNATNIRGSSLAKINSAINETRANYAQARMTLASSVASTRVILENNFLTKKQEANADGEATKAEIRTLFENHRLNIDSTILTKIGTAYNKQDHYQGQVNTKVDEQVGMARTKGQNKAASYPNTERGREQKNAVLGVANKTAQEMMARKPETIDAIAEIIQPIPEEFRDKGEEAKSGVDEHANNLLSNVDERITAITTQMLNHHKESLNNLKNLETQLNEQLSLQESNAVSQLQELIPQVNTQVQDAQQNSIEGLSQAKENAAGQISNKADEALTILQNGDNSKPEAVREFGDAILGFMSGASAGVLSSMSESAQQMVEKTTEILNNTVESVNVFLGGYDQAISTFLQNAENAFTSLKDSHLQGLVSIFDSLAQAFDDLVSQVEGQLSTTIQDLAADLDSTLSEAEGKIIEAVDEGLAKNEEALRELDDQMKEAAEDAAWNYDHPILAGIISVASFIGGLVAGILLVLATVVAFILLFKVIIAGLVALGVSLAIAKLIVLVAGLAILAYGVYSAYQARVSFGAEGGWATLGLAILDTVGITAIYQGFTAEGLSAFERGFLIGKGVATIASFFLARKIDTALSGKLPPAIANPGGGAVPVPRVRPGGGTSGGARIIPFRPSARPAAGGGRTGGVAGPRASAFDGNAARQLAPEFVPSTPQQPGTVIPFPSPRTASPAASSTASGSASTGAAGASASAGTHAATSTARRHKNQTCDNSILDRINRLKKIHCKEGLETFKCGPALRKLSNGKKIKGSTAIGMTRQAILDKIARMSRCLRVRRLEESLCFKDRSLDTTPDLVKNREGHDKAINDMVDGIHNCRELIRVADTLPAARRNLLPNNW